MELDQLQRRVDRALARRSLRRLRRDGDWHWPAYGLTRITAVALSHRHLESPSDWIEVVYLMTIHSRHAIPHAGHGARLPAIGKRDGSHFTFVQLGNSVYTASHTTQIITTYMGSNPPSPPRPP